MDKSLTARLVDAIEWMGGSADFSPNGQAREGWLRVVKPVLDEAERTLKRVPHRVFIVYENGDYIQVPYYHAWEYESDPGYLTTIAPMDREER